MLEKEKRKKKRGYYGEEYKVKRTYKKEEEGD